MSKVIKTIRTQPHWMNCPKYFLEAQNKGLVPKFFSGEYIILTDTKELYEISLLIMGQSPNGWLAREVLPDASVEETKNIYKMLIGSKFSGKEFRGYETKKELIKYILNKN